MLVTDELERCRLLHAPSAVVRLLGYGAGVRGELGSSVRKRHGSAGIVPVVFGFRSYAIKVARSGAVRITCSICGEGCNCYGQSYGSPFSKGLGEATRAARAARTRIYRRDAFCLREPSAISLSALI